MELPPETRLVHQAYRFELDPNNYQREHLAKHAGTARFAYNWGLERKQKAYAATGKSPRAIDLHKELNLLKKGELAWMYEVSKFAPQEALRDLDDAFKRFFKGQNRYPIFKAKGKARDSFRLTGPVRVERRRVRLPSLGWLRVKEPTMKLNGRILSATVSREADRWFVSFAVERERAAEVPTQPGSIVGVDLGLSCFAVLSDGTRVEGPNALREAEHRLAKLQRELSRKEKGSKNRAKAKVRVARAHKRIADVRKDFIHKLSTTLAKSHGVIVIEDLNVSGMLRNHSLAKSIQDQGWGEFRRQLEYKTDWYGSELVVADRFYPSSKTCSGCGRVKPALSLKERVYACQCGVEINRDLNAALNLVAWCGSSSATGRPPESEACGGDVRPEEPAIEATPEAAPVKQEASRDSGLVRLAGSTGNRGAAAGLSHLDAAVGCGPVTGEPELLTTLEHGLVA